MEVRVLSQAPTPEKTRSMCGYFLVLVGSARLHDKLSFMRDIFLRPLLASVAVLGLVYLWGGWRALVLAGLLAILETALSFDNAVTNARVLERMPPLWQKRFLTWGILTSVLGMRLLFPIVVVSAVTFMSPFLIAALAFTSPAIYASLIAGSALAIKAFGGTFLLLIALDYFLDESKAVHWIPRLERHFSRWGTIESMGVAVALCFLLLAAAYNPAHAMMILVSGIVGIVLFIALQGLATGLGLEATETARNGLALFIYLDMLDAVFSLDGVVGAFALTNSLPIIMAGLGIGAYFVRNLTIALVRGKTLKRLIYLEHGAHYAIAGLALCMLGAIVLAVPEWLTATLGAVFVTAAYFSSRRAVRISTQTA